eukprot:TRINITY_DN8468_c0_g4_i1.p1 TRINITY_DN8468_c0_g4~~TRINITY_DN8468_c0_g4_i1.p1  ORF type:complete len:745 (-),score=34.11 TRINITY_DN8468_c0_g4_i1:203-2437(-)
MFVFAFYLGLVVHAVQNPETRHSRKNASFLFEVGIIGRKSIALEPSVGKNVGFAQQATGTSFSKHDFLRCAGRRRRTVRFTPFFSIGGSVCMNGAGSIWDAQYCYTAHVVLRQPRTVSWETTNAGGCHVGMFSYKGNGKLTANSICMKPTKPKGLFREDTVYFQTKTRFLVSCGRSGASSALAADKQKDAAHSGAHGFIVYPLKNRRLIHHAEQVYILSARKEKRDPLGVRIHGCEGAMVRRGKACVGVGSFPSKKFKVFVLARRRGCGQILFGDHVSLISLFSSTVVAMIGTCCGGKPCTGALAVHYLKDIDKKNTIFRIGFSLHNDDICCKTLSAKVAECSLVGDSHIRSFDGLRINIYDQGIFWIIKNDCSMIQAIYMTCGKGTGCIGHLAMSGTSLLGHQMKLHAQRKAQLFWDTKAVTTVVWVMGVCAARAGSVWSLNLPCRLKVTSVVIGTRKLRYMNVFINSQKPINGVDGHCGNFNDRKDDDTRALIIKRKAWSVSSCSSLFVKQAKEKREPRLTLATCPAQTRTLVVRYCNAVIRRTTPNYVYFRKACALDACFVNPDTVEVIKKAAQVRRQLQSSHIVKTMERSANKKHSRRKFRHAKREHHRRSHGRHRHSHFNLHRKRRWHRSWIQGHQQASRRARGRFSHGQRARRTDSQRARRHRLVRHEQRKHSLTTEHRSHREVDRRQTCMHGWWHRRRVWNVRCRHGNDSRRSHAHKHRHRWRWYIMQRHGQRHEIK